jgi:hypothetical protein
MGLVKVKAVALGLAVNLAIVKVKAVVLAQK